MTFKSVVLSVFAALLLSGCMTNPQPIMTPLEMQNLQSRDYSAEKLVVFRSVVSVFQDMGYTITNADAQTGLISAESASKNDHLWGGDIKVDQTKATAFVEEIHDKTRVRLSFVHTSKTSSERGQTDRRDTPLLQGSFYRTIFDKIDNAIFIRRAN